MRKKEFVAAALAVCAPFAHATHYQVATGLQGASGAIYSPESLSVQPGDTIEFILIGVLLLYSISHPNFIGPRHHRSTVYQPLLVFDKRFFGFQIDVN
jgi:hypothetical protein